MKICLLLQRRFARVGHAIAINIKREHPDTRFCAYTEPRYNVAFLQNQMDIKYEGIFLDEDMHKALYSEKLDLEYLKGKEKEYGIPNLWPYIYIDRLLMSSQLIREYPNDKPLLGPEDLLRALQAGIKMTEKFLNEQRPDAVFMGVVNSLSSLLLYELAKKRGIKVIIFAGTRIKDGVILTEDYRTFTWARDIFKKTISGARPLAKESEARKFLREFRSNPRPYHPGLGVGVKKSKVSVLTSLRWYIGSIIRFCFNKERDYSDENPLWNIYDKFTRKIRGLSIQSRFWSEPIKNEKYSFFPLHLEPEMTILLLAPRYADQLHLIKQIARSLPIDQKLYVKEHPQMIGYRKSSYYKELLKIPNVKIIRPDIAGTEITKHAEIVYTIAGTAAWEGILLGRPVITFGNVFYNELSFVKRCNSYEELADLTKNFLTSFEYDEMELIHFISALLEDSVNAEVANLWVKSYTVSEIVGNAGINKLAKLIYSKLCLN